MESRFPDGSDGKESAYNDRDLDSDPGATMSPPAGPWSTYYSSQCLSFFLCKMGRVIRGGDGMRGEAGFTVLRAAAQSAEGPALCSAPVTASQEQSTGPVQTSSMM